MKVMNIILYLLNIFIIDAITYHTTVILGLLIYCMQSNVHAIVGVDECQVTPVIHVLQYPGCVPKPIPSFACTGRCSSYLQVNLNNNIEIIIIYNIVIFIMQILMFILLLIFLIYKLMFSIIFMITIL